MDPTITTIDPYPSPFNWSPTYTHECDEEALFGLLPCPLLCEGGWLPLVEGGAIECWGCREGR